MCNEVAGCCLLGSQHLPVLGIGEMAQSKVFPCTGDGRCRPTFSYAAVESQGGIVQTVFFAPFGQTMVAFSELETIRARQ
jgi:hypothetical protein